MKKCLILFLFFYSFQVYGQTNLDSLIRVTETLEDDSTRVMNYITITIIYKRINYDSAMAYAKKAEMLATSMNSKPLLAKTTYRKATVYINQNQSELAKKELNKAIQLSILVGDSIHLMAAQIDLGRLLQKNSKYDSAASVLFKAATLAKKLKDKNGEARIKNYLATIYYNQSQYDLTIKYYQEALQLVTDLNFKPGISAILTNLGETYLALEKYDSALIYQRQALQIKRELGDKLGMGRVYNHLANAHMYSLTSPKLDSGLYYFRKVRAIAEEVNDKNLKANALYGLVRTHFILGEYQTAKQIGHQLLTVIDSIQDLSLASVSYGYLSLVNASLDDPLKSVELREKANALADSLLDIDRLKLTQELEATYQNKEKQQAIELLESQNELQTSQIENRRIERNYLIALTAIMIILLVLIFNQYRLKKQSNDQLRQLDKIKSTFFANISHEFRTPLSLIMAPVQDKLAKTTHPDEKKFLRLIFNSANTLLKLINQLLDLAKLEEGKYIIDERPIEMTHFFRVVAESFHSLADDREIHFKIEVPKEEMWVKLDIDLFQKVCHNLLSNAFKFTPPGGLVNFDVNLVEEKLKIVVRDTGKGIPDDEQDKVFERFYQLDQENNLGTGIGLALTKELIEASKGEIRLKSKSGKGTEITIEVPVYQLEGEPSNKASLFPGLSEFEGGQSLNGVAHLAELENLLIIEDNKDLREFLSDILSSEFNVFSASDGKEGLSKALEIIPDLVISDVMMPEIDGMQVCESLKTDPATDHIPVVLLTAKAEQSDRLQGLTMGADHYLAKPFDPAELKVIVNNLVTQRRKLQEKYTQSTQAESSFEESIKHPFIEKCENIVLKHLSENEFSVESFAQEIAMSRMQLHRKLKSLTGLSATAFIRHQRLVSAKKLLEAGEPVSQVAYQVGYSSLSYFTSTFKDTFGVVPSDVVSTKLTK